jgi:hypothetical protein
MSRPFKDYTLLIDKLISLRGGGKEKVISKNLMLMSLAGAILQQRRDFSLEEIDSVLKDMGYTLSNMRQNAKNLVERGVYISCSGERYRFNPECVKSTSLEIPSEKESADIELKAKLLLMRFPLIYLAGVYVEGDVVFNMTKLRDYQTELEKLEISPEIQNKARELEEFLMKSGIDIPFLKYGNEPSQVAELLHKAGFRTPHGCGDCYSHSEHCDSRGKWDICYHYGNIQLRKEREEKEKFREQPEKVEIKEEKKKEVKREIKLDREDLQKKRIEYIETNLRQIKDDSCIPDKVYDHGVKILEHLVRKMPDYVERTTKLPDKILCLSAIDAGIIIEEVGHTFPDEVPFQESLRDLVKRLHDTGFSLSSGAELLVSTGFSIPGDGIRKIPKTVQQYRPPVSAPGPIPQPPKPIVSKPKESTTEGRDAVLRLLRRASNYVIPNNGNIRDLEELEKDGFVVSRVFLNTKTFKINEKGKIEYERRADEEHRRKLEEET